MRTFLYSVIAASLLACSSSPTAPAPALNYGSCTSSDIAGARNAHGTPQDSVQSGPTRVQWWYGVSRATGGNAGQSVPLVTFAGELASCQVIVT